MAKRERELTGTTTIAPEDFGPEDVGDEAAEGLIKASVSTVNPDNQALTQGQLAQVLQTLIDSSPVKKVPYAKFKTRSPFNPTGRKDRELLRRCYQNGYAMKIETLRDAEIDLLNRVKPGRYITGQNGEKMVTIGIVQKGGNTDLHIVYRNASVDDRFANKHEFRDLESLLQRCIEEETPAAVLSV